MSQFLKFVDISSFGDKTPGDDTCPLEPSSKWFGVILWLSFGSDDQYVSERLLNKFSTSTTKVVNVSSLSSQQIFTKPVQVVVDLDTSPWRDFWRVQNRVE
jgi:hypothetical protein